MDRIDTYEVEVRCFNCRYVGPCRFPLGTLVPFAHTTPCPLCQCVKNMAVYQQTLYTDVSTEELQ